MTLIEHQTIAKQLDILFSQSLDIPRPVQTLHTIREKIQARGYQQQDKEEILQGMGQLQYLMKQLHNTMHSINDQLNK